MQRFLPSEISSLLNIIGSDDNYKIISGPLGPKLSNNIKVALWAKIIARVAEESGQPPRDADKLKKVRLIV